MTLLTLEPKKTLLFGSMNDSTRFLQYDTQQSFMSHTSRMQENIDMYGQVTLLWINKILINMESSFTKCAIIPKCSFVNAGISLRNDSNEFNIRNTTQTI